MIEQQQTQKPVYAFDAAFKRLMKKLRNNGFVIRDVMPINLNRYIIVKGFERNIMVMFKREPFYNWGIMFRLLGRKGVGDTINVEDLKTAIRNNVEDIYTIFPSGIAYTIKLQDFLEKSIKWQNKEGKFVRSISIHEYKRYDII